MEIEGAELNMDVAKSEDGENELTMTLKIVVYGMDSLETAEAVCHRLTATLLDMVPQLEPAEIKTNKGPLN